MRYKVEPELLLKTEITPTARIERPHWTICAWRNSLCAWLRRPGWGWAGLVSLTWARCSSRWGSLSLCHERALSPARGSYWINLLTWPLMGLSVEDLERQKVPTPCPHFEFSPRYSPGRNLGRLQNAARCDPCWAIAGLFPGWQICPNVIFLSRK